MGPTSGTYLGLEEDSHTDQTADTDEKKHDHEEGRSGDRSAFVPGFLNVAAFCDIREGEFLTH